MQLCDEYAYYVYPAYGTAYRNMMPWLAHWNRALEGEFRFQHGFEGGGILAIPRWVPERTRNLAACRPETSLKRVYGTVLGNTAGQELSTLVCCAQEYRPPDMAVKWGLAPKLPDPTVGVTAEHVDSLGDERVLLVVPRPKRKSLKRIEELPAWFRAFGVEVEPTAWDMSPALREEIAGWFDDPTRTMFAFQMRGGEDNAAWQTAVTYYVAEYWDTQVRGLHNVHFLAAIDGKPCFRRNWKSNR